MYVFVRVWCCVRRRIHPNTRHAAVEPNQNNKRTNTQTKKKEHSKFDRKLKNSST